MSSNCSNFVMTIPHTSSSYDFSCIPTSQNIRPAYLFDTVHDDLYATNYLSVLVIIFFLVLTFWGERGHLSSCACEIYVHVIFWGDEPHSGDVQVDTLGWVEESLRNT